MSLNSINLLTGPVTISQSVYERFILSPISHRSSEFKKIFYSLKELLLQYTQAQEVEIFSGSGTLANEVVAQHIKCLSGKGLIVSNGEFGNRLIQLAESNNIAYNVYLEEWGSPLNWARIKELLLTEDYKWVWYVAHETSAGIWNYNVDFNQWCCHHNIILACDAISACGVERLDGRYMDFCTTVSGKSIAALPGIAMVFYKSKYLTLPHSIPQYLSLKYYHQQGGIPFTINTNLIQALYIAMQELIDFPHLEEYLLSLKNHLIARITQLDLCSTMNLSSAINNLTLCLPHSLSSVEVGDALLEMNCEIGYKSAYLIEKNIIQMHLTRNNTVEEIDAFSHRFNSVLQKLHVDMLK